MQTIELSEQEQDIIRAMDHNVLRAKAGVLEQRGKLTQAERAVEDAEAAFRTAMGVFGTLHGLTGQVRIAPDGKTLIVAGE